jgi:hypothetical protein
MEATRRQYTAEFKRDAVALYRHCGRPELRNHAQTSLPLERRTAAASGSGLSWPGGIKRRSTLNCASYERTIVGCEWSATF